MAKMNPFAKGGAKCPNCGKPMAQCTCDSKSKGKGKMPFPPKGPAKKKK